jgi:hypothetical protein
MWEASRTGQMHAQLKAITASVLVVDGDRDEPINREHTEYRFNTKNSIYYFGRLFKADPLPPVSSFLSNGTFLLQSSFYSTVWQFHLTVTVLVVTLVFINLRSPEDID